MMPSSLFADRPRLSHPGLRCARRARRAGSALVLVLGLVAITLAVSYAMMRSQSTSSQISSNQDRRGDARQAALTGLWVGFRKIHESSWNGPGTQDFAWLSDTEAYVVYYVLGDPSLTEDDPDWEQYPFRVTIYSQGYGIDPENSGVMAIHTMQAVLELNPTELGTQPSRWSTMQQYTLFQTAVDTFELDIPYRIEGPVRAQGQLRIARNYPGDDSARKRYFSDLKLMDTVGEGDYRPFTGPVTLYTAWQTSNDYYDLTTRLGVSVINSGPYTMGSDWSQPSSVSTYQIYPNGPTYNVETVSGTLAGTILEPDPITNPLGIFYCAGNLVLGSNVTIRGSLICTGNVTVVGTGVNLESVEMPGLNSVGGTLRLPVVSCLDFIVDSTAGGSVSGMLAIFDDLQYVDGPDTTAFAIAGRVAAKEIRLGKREPWDSISWSTRYSQFMLQYLLGVKYFPKWLHNNYGHDPEGKITIVPDPETVSYDWFTYNGSEPVVVYDSGDNCLHWNILEWNENATP